VTVEVVEEGILVRPASHKLKLSLAQRLKAFDPAIYGGEAMAEGRVGVEVGWGPARCGCPIDGT
jgi:hypothetical protein